MSRKGIPRSYREPAIDRLMRRVVEDDAGCWVFQGTDNGVGYGVIFSEGQSRYTHRVAYEYFVGEIPDGLITDHLCRNRKCCNPWHLEPVPHRINLLRGVGVSAIAAAKTHCVHGHEFTPHNTYRTTQGGRSCRECARLYQRARRARESGAA